MTKTFVLPLVIGLLALSLNAHAQEQPTPKTLLGNHSTINTEELGFFLVPTYGITTMDGSTASLFNLRGGLSLKDKLSLGAYFSTSLNRILPQSETEPNVYMDYWTVGGFAEYTLLSHKLVHLTLPLFLGYGEVQMDNEMGNPGLGEANFFQVEPAAFLEVNLHRYVRFNVGAGYRFVSAMTYRNFDQSDITGATGYIGLKLGLFQ